MTMTVVREKTVVHTQRTPHTHMEWRNLTKTKDDAKKFWLCDALRDHSCEKLTESYAKLQELKAKADQQRERRELGTANNRAAKQEDCIEKSKAGIGQPAEEEARREAI